MARQIAIRLGTEGKAQVVADLDAIGAVGDASAKRLANSYVKASRDADAALEFANRQATKLAALLPGLNPTKLDMAAGVRDGIGKSAESSAAIFEAAYAKMEARATALRAAIDPAFGAQQRFDREMAEARTLISAGAISLDDYVAKLRQERAALDAVSGGHAVYSKSAGALRGAMQGVSYQVQDTFTQLSMGANVLQVVAIQGGQLAGQFSNLEGRAGNFARFMIGPWGLAITAGMLVLGPLLGKLLDTNNAVEDGVNKLKKDAAESDAAARAKARFARSVEGLTVALRDQDKALRDSADGERSAAERANLLARQKRDQALATRQATAAALAAAEADLGDFSLTGATTGAAALQNQARADRVAKLRADRTKADALVKDAERQVNVTRVDLAAEQAVTSLDPVRAITKAYDDRIKTLKDQQREEARLGRQVGAASIARLRQIESEKQAAIKAEQDKQKAVGETARQYGREVSSSEASAIARAAGLQVNSADRSTARQKQLYDSWVAQGKPKENPVAKPGTSAHERGNALDIQFQAGVTAKKIKDAFAAEGVRLTKVFAETGHWHVEWARTAAQRSAASDTAKETRELAKANRDLDSDLEQVVKQFDPARAAADEYATSLAKIDALLGAGRITRGQASGYRMDAFHEEQKRQADAQLAQFKTLFGNDDPLADIMGNIQIERDAKRSADEERQERQRQGVQDLAGYYRQAMTGGTTSFLEMMRERGLQVISELLAKWTLGKVSTGGSGNGLLGAIGKLFGGASALAGSGGSSLLTAPNIGGTPSAMDPLGSGIPKLASGTEYWSGGTALLGEHGPEMAQLPKGTRVTPAGATQRALAGNDTAKPPVTHNYFSGNLMTPEFWDRIQAGDAGAAIQGAAGGAAMSQADGQRSRARQLGRRW
jgi:hypothetical protein